MNTALELSTFLLSVQLFIILTRAQWSCACKTYWGSHDRSDFFQLPETSPYAVTTLSTAVQCTDSPLLSDLLCPAAPFSRLCVCGRCRTLLHVWASCTKGSQRRRRCCWRAPQSINRRGSDSRRPELSCPEAHFCGLASPEKENLSCKEQKQVWGSEPAAQV